MQVQRWRQRRRGEHLHDGGQPPSSNVHGEVGSIETTDPFCLFKHILPADVDLEWVSGVFTTGSC